MLDKKIKIILPCHFCLETVTKREVIDMGFSDDSVVDEEVKINTTFREIPRLNISLRTYERVLIEFSYFKAETFEDLYQNVLNIPFEKYVKVNSSRSAWSAARSTVLFLLQKQIKTKILNRIQVLQ